MEIDSFRNPNRVIQMSFPWTEPMYLDIVHGSMGPVNIFHTYMYHMYPTDLTDSNFGKGTTVTKIQDFKIFIVHSDTR